MAMMAMMMMLMIGVRNLVHAVVEKKIAELHVRAQQRLPIHACSLLPLAQGERVRVEHRVLLC
jgi:hypothetical protein